MRIKKSYLNETKPPLASELATPSAEAPVDMPPEGAPAEAMPLPGGGESLKPVVPDSEAANEGHVTKVLGPFQIERSSDGLTIVPSSKLEAHAAATGDVTFSTTLSVGNRELVVSMALKGVDDTPKDRPDETAAVDEQPDQTGGSDGGTQEKD